jgi:hypothetical protein
LFESAELLDLIFQRGISYFLFFRTGHINPSLLRSFCLEEKAKCAAVAGFGAETNFTPMKLTYLSANVQT